MKHIIQTYYREPQVDRERILRNLSFSAPDPSMRYWVRIAPLVGVSMLFLSFAYFLIDFNIEFLATVVSLYSAI